MTLRLIITAAAFALTSGACAGPVSAQKLIPALEKLAAQNNAEAIYHLGMAWHTGSGVPQDHAKALDAFRRGAALGDPLAAYKLGCYYAGQGGGIVAPDEDAALKFKMVAAGAGYALAQQDVGAIYARRGEPTIALKWLGKSADQGWPDALMTMASVHNGFAGVDKDPAKTSAYFRLFLSRSDASPDQKAWLDTFDAGLSSDDRRRSDSIIAAYRPQPTTLTIKALSGQRAAETLVGSR